MHRKLLACIRPPDITFTSLFKLLTLVVNASGLSHETGIFFCTPFSSYSARHPLSHLAPILLLFFSTLQNMISHIIIKTQKRYHRGYFTSGRETIFLTTTTGWNNRGEKDFSKSFLGSTLSALCVCVYVCVR